MSMSDPADGSGLHFFDHVRVSVATRYESGLDLVGGHFLNLMSKMGFTVDNYNQGVKFVK